MSRAALSVVPAPVSTPPREAALDAFERVDDGLDHLASVAPDAVVPEAHLAWEALLAEVRVAVRRARVVFLRLSAEVPPQEAA